MSTDRRTGARATLFGRDQELAALVRALQQAAAGRGSVILLSGEAGIGKTALCELLAGQVQAAGGAVGWARCVEGSGAPPFWPWSALVGSAAQRAGASTATGAAPDPGDRFRLFESVSAALGSSEGTDVRLYVIDDARWADASSLELLAFVTQQRVIERARVVLVATYRESDLAASEALAACIGRVSRAPGTTRVTLGGLDREAMAALVEAEGGHPSLVDEVQARSGGNPFLAAEVLRLVRSGGGGVATGLLPAESQEIITAGLGGLSEDATRLLGAAAVVGREFAVGVAAELAGLDSASALAAIDEAERARVVTPGTESASTYRFVHALVRDGLYSQLSSLRRRELHAGAARSLAAMAAWSRSVQPGEIAEHSLRAIPLLGADEVTAHVQRAGSHAVRELAFEAAAGLYSRAIEAIEVLAGAGREVVVLSLALGDALMQADRRADATRAYRRGFEAARQAAPASDLARAAIGFATASFRVGEPQSAALEMLNEAATRLPGAELALRSRLTSRIVWALGVTDRSIPRANLAKEAVGLAREAADDGALHLALWTRHMCLPSEGPVEPALASAREMVAIGVRAGDLKGELVGRHLLVQALLEDGNFADARREMVVHRSLARELRDTQQLNTAASWDAMLALHDCDFERAGTLIHEQVRGANEKGNVSVLIRAMGQQWARRRALGKLPDPRVESPQVRGFDLGAWRSTTPLAYLAHGDEASARREFEAVAANGFRELEEDTLRAMGLALAAEVAWRLGDRARAALVLEMLAPLAGRNLLMADGVVSLGPADLFRGRLALTLGETELAEHALAAAFALAERMGGPACLAEVRLGLAELALTAGKPAEALQHLADVETVAAARGLVALRSDAARVRAAAEALRENGAMPGGLSPREAEVLRLLAAGKSNAQIAQELVLSANTVARHLSNAYVKINVANRTEATRWAIAHGLVER